MREAVVITCSTRAASGEYLDRSGPYLVNALREWGFHVDDAMVVADGPEVAAALEAAVRAAPSLVLTTGGTGLNPTDRTPEQTRPLLDRLIPGIPEALRSAGVVAGVPSAILSRGLAGVAGRTLVINLPGSLGGVRDAVKVLADVVPHAIDQLAGGDHPR